MTDEELLRAFEAGTDPPGGFHHADHVHVAWCYLRSEPLDGALERFRRKLRAFAAAHGVPERYHETITTAYVLLIADRRDAIPGATWEAFAAANGDLLVWKPSVLDRYYRTETLTREEARLRFVAPDKAPLPSIQSSS